MFENLENNACKEFFNEVQERQEEAYSAKHKKLGSNSRKCGLPCDYMTKKQLLKKNGECTVFIMNAPCTFDTFKTLSDDLKVEYIEKLMNTYGVSVNRIATMMKVTPWTLYLYIRKSPAFKNIKTSSVTAKYMNAEQRLAWNAFLNKFNWPSGLMAYANSGSANNSHKGTLRTEAGTSINLKTNIVESLENTIKHKEDLVMKPTTETECQQDEENSSALNLNFTINDANDINKLSAFLSAFIAIKGTQSAIDINIHSKK